jgi:hypothetical protein
MQKIGMLQVCNNLLEMSGIRLNRNVSIDLIIPEKNLRL